MQRLRFYLNIIALFINQHERCTVELLARFSDVFFGYLEAKQALSGTKCLLEGQVAFTLSEEWGVLKGPPPNSFVEGEATITLEYLNGSTERIGFLDSDPKIWVLLAGSDGGGYGTGQFSGTDVFTQTASLAPGAVFQIVSSSPAQEYDPQTPFQGGQAGAYVKGFVSKYSTDATPVTPASGPSTSNIPPPSAPGSAPSNIHAVIISGLSDPAKVIVSSNVTLTGGVVALGRDGSTPSTWSPGLKIIPDYALLTAKKSHRSLPISSMSASLNRI